MNTIFEEFLLEINKEKQNERPCSTPYKYSNKIIKKVQRVLDDIDSNRNHSWAIEIYNRNKDNMNNIAIKYRGVRITYRDMFINSYMYAKSLKRMGFRKKSEIPMCITNTPEFIYMILAVSFIGAKSKIVGDWFNSQYLTEILNKSNSKILFLDDISYEKIKHSIFNSNIETLVCFSLMDSFKKDENDNEFNLYDEIDSMFHIIKNNYDFIKQDYDGEVLNLKSFVEVGELYSGNVIENVDLDSTCSITYTSGTTLPGRPKGVKQSNRSYITLSRFKESDVSGMPTMKNMSVLAHIPTYTHMELSCAISDTLYCGCTLALEPFYDKDFFPYSLMINKPNFVPASVGFWVNLCKLLNFDEKFKNVDMPYLMIPTVTGEGLSAGEEKFLNLTSRKHKFGVERLPFPLAPVTFSIGGGTTESSGIFVTLFKALQEKKLNHLIKKDTLGLTPHKFAEVEVLDKNGNYCKPNEPGLLVAINPCEMIGYTDDVLNKNTHIRDVYGREWLNLGTYSYKDTTGRIKMKGRMKNYFILNDGTEIPYYVIEDTILSDTKNVMSCTIVNDDNNNLICHIELQPYRKKTESYIMKSIIDRINYSYSKEVTDKLYFRLRDIKESFPIDPSGKRSLSILEKLGVDDKTLSFSELQSKYGAEKNAKKLQKSRF